MKKIYFSTMLMLITSAFAFCQVTVTFTLTSGTSLNVPPAGLSNVTFNVNLSKPSTQVTDGNVFIYAQGGSGGASKLNYQGVVSSGSWSGSGATQSFSLSGSFSISQSQLGGVSGVVFAQYESSTGVNSKSGNIVAAIPISNNTLTPPSVTSFNGSGNPSVIIGSMPTGGGGTGSYTYQWQSSTTSTTSGFANIASATSSNYDPPTISQTTYYRRVVTSESLTNTSNVVTITISALPPISNNSISNSGSSLFYGSGDPSLLTGSLPTGGTNFFTYKWQSSTTSATTGFSDIPSATSQNYDPPTISQTTYYRRIVTSGSATSTSNVITIVIEPNGSSFDNPINIGNLNIGSTYSSPLEPRGYYYKFNLTTSANLNLSNCKPSGVSGTFNLFDASRNPVSGGVLEYCDYGYGLNFNLQPGIYYVVTQGDASAWTNIHLFVSPICPIVSTSPNVTILAGSSTTLSASGTDSYTWSPATGLSSTTGASVTASPTVTTTYTVFARRSDNYCGVYKNITVTVAGAIGSTINNPIVANIGGCGYTSPFPFLNTTGYGNEYGGPSEDIFFKFTLSNPSEVYIFSNHIGAYLESGLHVVLLNNSGAFLDEQYYGWIDSGDDAGSYFYGELDRTPLKFTLQSGSYFLVVEGTNGYKEIAIGIETPTGYSCRKDTSPTPTKTKKEAETKNKDQSKLASVVVYPNPANQFISFNLEQDATALVYIISSNGSIVKETTITGTSPTSNISDLPSGLYLVKIVQGNKIHSEKILIER